MIQTMKTGRINELIELYNLKNMPEPKRDAHVEVNGAIICLRWWSQKPFVSIQRTAAEKARLTASDKFGDVIPFSALRAFQQALLDVVPELKDYARADSPYEIQFHTFDNVATFYLLLDRIDENKDLLAMTIKK